MDIGDVFTLVGLPRLDGTYALHVVEEWDAFFLPVLPVMALVVGRLDEFALVVPITTSSDVADVEGFLSLVGAGDVARYWATLPALARGWGEQEAIAVLFQPATVPVAYLERAPVERLATMTPRARAQLQQRFGSAWLP